jgi:hypothetical protein
MVNKPATAGDVAIVANLDSFPDIELATRPDKTIIPDHDAWARLIYTVKVKVHIVLNYASITNLHLMRPGHVQRGETSSLTNLHALY